MMKLLRYMLVTFQNLCMHCPILVRLLWPATRTYIANVRDIFMFAKASHVTGYLKAVP